ncbi:2-keto-4-methylthiobutyrate aminotransferase [Schleiferia thermophila]|uniref:2-keto-4-methylthiobutyrate aminotransferase n=2 Tax=Schleiferia thermophila TaxID=884107 RepID=A0A369AAN9_9FLAO|nr:2-keto-4-methylthiobutyrate aminotransferase [Schleiferia thermophila]
MLQPPVLSARLERWLRKKSQQESTFGQKETDLMFPSKFPDMATTIFTKMTSMANEYKAVNVSQGFPDFGPPQELIDHIALQLRKHHHQYAPMPGLPALRSAIAELHHRTRGELIDPDSEITITAGATQGLFAAIAALVRDGDEVIVLAPAYDSYAPAAQLMGARVKEIHLNDDFSLPIEQLQQNISHHTRLIIVNNPHNPSGACLSHDELMQLQALSMQHKQLWFLFDEVYQHLVFDGRTHHSALMYPELRKKSACVFSFGKSLNATGWKVGYIVAHEYYTREIRKIHQYEVFAVNSFLQSALADFLPVFSPSAIAAQIQSGRDLLQNLMGSSRFIPLPARGGYFQLYDYSQISDESDMAFTERLVREQGVATIPVSAFYQKPPKNQYLIRICFAKKPETLQLAAERLKNL